jgi:hypothetical protein
MQVAQAASRSPITRAVLAVLGVAAIGTAAWAGWRALGHQDSSPAQPGEGTRELGTIPSPTTRPQHPQPAVPTTPVAAPAPIVTQPGAGYLQLTKIGPRAADSATDPAAFHDVLAADGPGWAASDGTISVPLPDGRSLWLFGDTLMNLPNADGSLRRNADFVRNSAILLDGNRATTLVTGTAQDAGDFLHPEDPSEWYWPGHGTVQDDDLLLFMGRVHSTADGAPGWNFAGNGSDLLRLDLRDLSVKERIHMPGGARFDWGTAVISDRTHTYVYGFQGEGFERHAHVARVPKGQLGDAPFEFWDGHGWTKDVEQSVPIADGVSNSYSVTRTPAGKWAMVSQELFFGTGLQVRTADSPAGPWSDWRSIDPGPAKAEGQISYNAQVHPEFTEDGKLLASWNMNRSDATLPSPDQLEGYRPQFRAVDASLLDG